MNADGMEGAAPSGRPFHDPDAAGGAGGWQLIARCIADHHRGDLAAAVTLTSDAEDERALPASHFFRAVEELPVVEREALERTRGSVLDVGAGAGAHALHLQEAGHRVTAIEISDLAVEVMTERGVRDARRADIFSEPDGERWDTLLILMNGTTLVGSEAGLTELFLAASARMAPGGQILIDSTDLRGEREDAEDFGNASEDQSVERQDGRYIGEVQLQLSYGGERSEPFPVLYADPDMLRVCAEAAGLQARVVVHGEDGAYLAEVTRP